MDRYRLIPMSSLSRGSRPSARTRCVPEPPAQGGDTGSNPWDYVAPGATSRRSASCRRPSGRERRRPAARSAWPDRRLRSRRDPSRRRYRADPGAGSASTTVSPVALRSSPASMGVRPFTSGTVTPSVGNERRWRHRRARRGGGWSLALDGGRHALERGHGDDDQQEHHPRTHDRVRRSTQEPSGRRSCSLVGGGNSSGRTGDMPARRSDGPPECPQGPAMPPLAARRTRPIPGAQRAGLADASERSAQSSADPTEYGARGPADASDTAVRATRDRPDRPHHQTTRTTDRPEHGVHHAPGSHPHRGRVRDGDPCSPTGTTEPLYGEARIDHTAEVASTTESRSLPAHAPMAPRERRVRRRKRTADASRPPSSARAEAARGDEGAPGRSRTSSISLRRSNSPEAGCPERIRCSRSSRSAASRSRSRGKATLPSPAASAACRAVVQRAAGDPEIEDLHPTRPGQEDAVGGEAPVHEADGVRGIQRGPHFRSDPASLGGLDGSGPDPNCSASVSPSRTLHRDVHDGVRALDVRDRPSDVGVLESRPHPRQTRSERLHEPPMGAEVISAKTRHRDLRRK